MHKYILLFTLLLLAACSASSGSAPSSSGRSYADELRQRSGNNGQPGEQTPTALRPSPTSPAPPSQPRQVMVMPTPQTQQQTTDSNSAVGAIEQISSDFAIDDATVSLAAFITSTPAMFIFATVVAGLVIRKKERR